MRPYIRLFTFLSCTLGMLVAETVAENKGPFPGKKSKFHGYDRYDFSVKNNRVIVVVPSKPSKLKDGSRPWIWRARFFGHEPQADKVLLGEHGFHLVYCNVGNLFGSPKAVQRWNDFYAYLTSEHNFSKKAALEGMSRGGLIIYNWAAANPDKVSCIYGDAPVCDFKSWPAGKGKGKYSKGTWEACLRAYGFSEEQALAFKGNPIDNLSPLAKAGIPLLHVVGDADPVVPVAENTAILEERYKALGGSIQVIHKPGVSHHPHSLKDPKRIVDFVVENTF